MTKNNKIQLINMDIIQSYYGDAERHLKIRWGEHIGTSPLTFKKVKPSAESSIRHGLKKDLQIIESKQSKSSYI